MKKLFCFCTMFSLVVLLPRYGVSQAIANSQSLELRGGKTFSVGDYASLRYRHTTSTSVDLSFAVFINAMQKNGLRYSSYGLDLMGEYYTGVGDNTDHLFELKAGGGTTVLVDREPFVYKDLPFSKRLNYGVVGELTGDWCISENISLTLFTQQKYLFNKSLGTYCFTAGLGIKVSLD